MVPRYQSDYEQIDTVGGMGSVQANMGDVGHHGE